MIKLYYINEWKYLYRLSKKNNQIIPKEILKIKPDAKKYFLETKTLTYLPDKNVYIFHNIFDPIDPEIILSCPTDVEANLYLTIVEAVKNNNFEIPLIEVQKKVVPNFCYLYPALKWLRENNLADAKILRTHKYDNTDLINKNLMLRILFVNN